MFDNIYPSRLRPRFKEGEQVLCRYTGEEIWTVGACSRVQGVFLYDVYQPGYLKCWVEECDLIPVTEKATHEAIA